MPDYQVVARKYRPQCFHDVLGQDALISTLKNAIKYGRLAQAYLFSGSRGTGKTTVARILAKALNCQNLSPEQEPCNACPSCKEITGGHSLDVLEIDGASHRGIEDIRQINETVGYASSSGMYKIYIIDEVHMLTKEAFNALLKTLEEPPPRVKFFFATTEPHKVLPTIVSRCQRFNLNRIPPEVILDKLQFISKELGLDADIDALQLIASMAEGGLRDAESLLDQVFSFHEGRVTLDTIHAILGTMPKEIYFEIDRAGKQGELAKAFEIVEQVFAEGKDLTHFLEGLIDHFRTLLIVKVSGKNAPFLIISEKDKELYEVAAKYYTREQCLTLLEYLLEAQQQIRFSPSIKIALEGILLKIMRVHQRIPIEVIVQRLGELEQKLGTPPTPPLSPKEEKPASAQIVEKTPQKPQPPAPIPATLPTPPPPKEALIKEPLKKIENTLTEDPTPTERDITGRSIPQKEKPRLEQKTDPIIAPEAAAPRIMEKPLSREEQSRYDTLMQFAAVELEGTIQKKFY